MLPRSPQHRPSISEDEVRRWFIEVGCEPQNLDPIAMDLLVSHLQGLKLVLEQEFGPNGEFDPKLASILYARQNVYEALMTLREAHRDAGHSVEHLDKAILQNFPKHPDYTNRANRWRVHAHHVYGLVMGVIQQAKVPWKLPKKGGSETGPVMRVVFNALEAIDNLERDPGAVRKHIERGVTEQAKKAKDPWRQFWRIKKFPEKWRWTKKG